MTDRPFAMSLHRSTEPSRPAAAILTSLRCVRRRVPRRTSACGLCRIEHGHRIRLIAGLGWACAADAHASVAMARTAMRRSNTKRALWKVERAIIAERAVTPRVAVATLQGPRSPAGTLGTTGLAAARVLVPSPHGWMDQRTRRPRRRARGHHARRVCRAETRLPTRNSPACPCRRDCIATFMADSRTRCWDHRDGSRSARHRRLR
jgi:hypothetical protein